MSRYCRDCRFAVVAGASADGPLCRCARGHWGGESEPWAVALVAPGCGDFVAAAEEPGSLELWGLAGGFGLEPEPRRRRRTHGENLYHLLSPAAV